MENVFVMDAKSEIKPRDGFIYDAIMRGYDTSFFKTIDGTPSVSSNKVRLNAAEIGSYPQIKRGTVEFAVNIPAAPTAGDARKIALLNPSAPTRGSIYFEVVGAVFQVVSYDDDGTTETTAITGSTIHGAEKLFKIEWGPDYIIFFLDGVAIATHKTRVGSIAQGLYIINGNSDNMDVGYILVKETANLIS
jgi:hypothetical protein